MPRRWILALLAVAMLPVLAAEETGEAGHARHDFSDAERWAGVFEDPSRRAWQKPREVVELLGIQRGTRVADLGSGTGFFLPTLCAAVGEAGRVYAVDVEESMVDYVRERKDLERYREFLIPVLAEPDDPNLPPQELDVVLVVNTWHHIDGRIDYLKRLRRSLRHGGRVAIVDWRMGDLPFGPPPEERLSPETVVAEFEQAGWIFDSESVLLPYQYFLIFEQPE